MKDEYTIGEIGKLYNLGSDSLRYYEKKGILSPKRGKNGYRYYKIDDIWRLNLIKSMRKLNFSIDDIRKYLDERTVNRTIDLIQHEISFINKKITPLINLKQDLETRLNDLLQDCYLDTQNTDIKIEYKHFPTRKIMLLETAIEKDYEVDWAFRNLEHEDESLLTLFANKHRGAFIKEDSYQKGDYTKYEAVFLLWILNQTKLPMF